MAKKQIQLFVLFCFSALCFASKLSWMEGFYMVASVRWYSFLCWEKSLLPESIVKRFNIIRQLVVWLKEIPHTRNSHGSLFLEEKLSSGETWIHWKAGLNKTDLKKEWKGLLSKGPCQWSHPIFVSEILKDIQTHITFFWALRRPGFESVTFKPVDVSVLI